MACRPVPKEVAPHAFTPTQDGCGPWVPSNGSGTLGCIPWPWPEGRQTTSEIFLQLEWRLLVRVPNTRRIFSSFSGFCVACDSLMASRNINFVISVVMCAGVGARLGRKRTLRPGFPEPCKFA